MQINELERDELARRARLMLPAQLAARRREQANMARLARERRIAAERDRNLDGIARCRAALRRARVMA